MRKESDKTINHIIRKCVEIALTWYKSMDDCSSKVIQYELYKRLKFNHIDIWYMHKQESVLENKAHKILDGFTIKTDYSILSKRLNPLLKPKKRTHQRVGFDIPTDYS